MSTITYNETPRWYDARDEEVMIDLFGAKIIDTSPTLASEMVSSYIDKYNHAHKAGCRNIRDVAEFEAMRIRAGGGVQPW